MNRVLKMLLLWLLALALPMQGYAAATMLACQTTLMHTMGQTSHVHHMAEQAGNDGSEHHASMHHVPNLQVSQVHDHSHDSASAQHSHSSCSTCAVCCIGVAVMPAGLDWHAPHTGAQRSSASLVVSFSGHIPPGIERPPRTVIA